MKNKDGKIINGFLFFNKRIKYSDIILGIFLIFITILGVRSYKYKNEKLNGETIIIIGKVVWIGQSAGKRVGQCEVKCNYTYKSKNYQRNFECKDLNVDVGDCVEIIQSLDDDNISDINYKKGRINCQ